MTTTGQRAGTSANPLSSRGGGRSRRWWRRPWVVPVAVVVLAFLVYSLPPYITLDPEQARVPQPRGFEVHYPLLLGHIVFGSIAITTCCLQVWPWFRKRYPQAHRRIGRGYVFAGALPSAVLAFVIGASAPFGPVAAASNVVLSVLWFTVTVAGFRAARARRFGEHRKWMIRSFVLTISTMTNRIWNVVWISVLAPQLDTTFGGDPQLLVQTVAGLSTWLGWTIPLLICQWWLERRPAAKGS